MRVYRDISSSAFVYTDHVLRSVIISVCVTVSHIFNTRNTCTLSKQSVTYTSNITTVLHRCCPFHPIASYILKPAKLSLCFPFPCNQIPASVRSTLRAAVFSTGGFNNQMTTYCVWWPHYTRWRTINGKCFPITLSQDLPVTPFILLWFILLTAKTAEIRTNIQGDAKIKLH